MFVAAMLGFGGERGFVISLNVKFLLYMEGRTDFKQTAYQFEKFVI